MKKLVQGLFSIIIIPLIMVGCNTTKKADNLNGKRIYIPQEKISLERTPSPKVIPYTYNQWTASLDNLRQVREYERFLQQQGVGNIIPSFELMRSARDWQKCGRSQYMIPNRELWQNQVETLRIFKYLVAAKVLTDFEVTSVYRDLSLNQCAGGAGSSRHLFNSAIDFRIGPVYPMPQDYAYIEHTKFRLCEFWRQHGQSFNMGLGLYANGQIHIDTYGYRTWGPNLSRTSSPCNY
jgi:hypothetical protein